MKSIMKLFGILMILAVVSLSGCIGEDATEPVIDADIPEEDVQTSEEQVDAEMDIISSIQKQIEEQSNYTIDPNLGGGQHLSGTSDDYRTLVAGVDGSPGSYVSPDPEIVVLVDEEEEFVDEGEPEEDVGSGESEEDVDDGEEYEEPEDVTEDDPDDTAEEDVIEDEEDTTEDEGPTEDESEDTTEDDSEDESIEDELEEELTE